MAHRENPYALTSACSPNPHHITVPVRDAHDRELWLVLQNGLAIGFMQGPYQPWYRLGMLAYVGYRPPLHSPVGAWPNTIAAANKALAGP